MNSFIKQNKNLLIVIVLTVIFFALYQTNSSLVANNDIKDFINDSGIWAPIVFIIFFIVAAIFFVPKIPLIILGAAIFGIFWGTIYSIIGTMVGATIEFIAVRYFFDKKYKAKFEKKFHKIVQAEEKYKKTELLGVFLLYSMPLPFAGVTIILSISNIKFINFFFGLLLNSIPICFIYAYFGHSLFHLKYTHLIISTALVILLIYASTKLVKRLILNKKTNQN